MDPGKPESIPFSFFVSLLHDISQIPPQKSRHPRWCDSEKGRVPYPALNILHRWIAKLHNRYAPLQPNTTLTFFRLLFPEEDVGRKYGLQETQLASQLLRLSASSHERGQYLRRWNSHDASGCLGSEVKKILDKTCTLTASSLSVTEVDGLLDELAATCAFSDTTIRRLHTRQQSKYNILCRLYDSVTPLDASFLTQIILKDLRPLLYPASYGHYTAALTKLNSNSVVMLRKEDAMMAWDPSGQMLNTYRVRCSLGEASKAFEASKCDFLMVPQVGIPIEIPKSVKGRGCTHALSLFSDSSKVWAETKYDGERAQIHVEVSEDGSSRMTIFSKSKRNSTLDRYAVHSVIRDALGLAAPGESVHKGSGISKNVVLDAEMVAYSNRYHKIDEFWHICNLVESTARGIRGTRKIQAKLPPNDQMQNNAISQSSLLSDVSDDDTRHLALVFFDILILDSIPLLSHPYSVRRSLLESVVERIPGRSMLAHRTPVVLNHAGGVEEAEKDLRKIFAHVIADHQEGVVIKADTGAYNDRRMSWVKLKRDYIPNYGDTIDLVVIAAGWDKHRARELLLTPTAFTTFYLGVLANAKAIKADPSTLPHFEVYFTSSYGMSRDQLEEVNFFVKASDPVEYRARLKMDMYTFNLFAGLRPPAVMLQVPLLAELFGAGFTKAHQSKYYELRFPRITKLFRPNERGWREGLDLSELHGIAREAVGRDRPGKDVDDWCKELWGVSTSPNAKSTAKRKLAIDAWEKMLAEADEPATKKRKRTGGSPPSLGRTRARHLGSSALGSLTNLLQPKSKYVAKVGRWSWKEREDGNEDVPVLPTSGPGRSIARSMADDWLSNKEATLSTLVHVSLDRSSPLKVCKRGEMASTVHHSPVPVPKPVHTLVKFLQNALVWFAGSGNMAVESSMELVPPECWLHSIEALLFGCGWGDQPDGWTGCEWVERGVIFVDDSTKVGEKWKGYVLKKVKEREAMVSDRRRRRIWVLNSCILGLGIDDIESQILYTLPRLDARA